MPSSYKTHYKDTVFTQMTINAVLLSGAFFVLMQPFVLFGYKLPDMGFLAWVYLVPLVVAIYPYNLKKKILLCFLMGVVGNFGMLYWLLAAMQRFGGLNFFQSMGILTALILLLSLKHAICLGLACWVNLISKIPLFTVLPPFMLAHNLLLHYYIFGGFPWGMPAYSQGEWIRFFQWVDHTGIFGLSGYIYLVNALIAEGAILLIHKKHVDKMMARLVMVLVLAMLSFYGSFLSKQEFERTKVTAGNMMVALVQGNVSQEMKWDLRRAKENLGRYMRLTHMAVKNGAELVLWPETAYPFGLTQENFSVESFLDEEKMPTPMIIGAVTTRREADGPKLMFNSVVQIDTAARVVAIYSKMHLVPFGEYLPLKSWLVNFRKLTHGVGEFTPGSEFGLFDVNHVRFASLICYEDIYDDIAREFAIRGADVLVNYTNDAWYGQSSAQYQHLVYSQFRALENRKPLLRTTNTGLTAVISAEGSVVDDLPPFKEAYLLHALKVEKGQAPFTRHGHAWVFIVVGMAGAMLLYTVIKWRFGPVKVDL